MTIEDDDGLEHEVPTRWEICDTCDGEGKHSRAVERDGGGFTSSEWAEEDPDFREDYLAGRYDQPCDTCQGSGKVRVPDYDRMPPALRALVEAHERDEAEYRAICAAERRMGA